MTGGDLRIEVLPAGAVVPAFGLLDAVSRARSTAATACSCTTTASRTRSRCGARARRSAWTRTCCSPGTSTAAARSCSNKLYASIGANVVSFPYGPMPTQPLGWFKKPITKAEDLKGLKFRTVGISIDVFTAHGRGGERAARRRDRAGDGPRPARRGGVQQRDLRPHPRLPRRLQGVHAAELPPERRAVRDHVQQDQVRRAAGEDEGDHRERGRSGLGRTCRGRRSTATRRTTSSCRPRTRCVKFYKTPDSILQQQLDGVRRGRRRSARTTRCSGEIEASQKAFAERAVRWDLDTNVNRAHGLQPLLRQAGAGRSRRRRRPDA